MSREQAKGKPTDRTLWAFGCVLYEMLTGRAVFDGESVGEILGAIFKTEPDWTRLPAQTPASVRRLLRRCLAVLYRVSSRSFPNRTAVERSGRIGIVPWGGHESDLLASPYISYTCLRIAGDWAVASNGYHTDPIAEKLGDGVPVRDALAGTLLALDYERDELRTPRIAAAVPLRGDRGWLAIVRHNGLEVKELELAAGRAVYLATYGANEIREDRVLPFDAKDALAAARVAVDGPGFAELEKPVTSAAACVAGSRFALATHVV